MELKVKNTRLVRSFEIRDGIDGTIFVAEENNHISFPIKRVYHISGLHNPGAIRGKHAHKTLEQVLFCINGSCQITLDDGSFQQRLKLDKPQKGIYLGINLWHTMENFKDNCVLLVLASQIYNENDYIRDYSEFLKYLQQENQQTKSQI